MEDTEIIDLYFARSEDAIRETADKYGAYLHTIAYHILHREEDTEEVLSDTYLGTWNAIPPEKPRVLRHFLSRITRHLSFKRLEYLGAACRSAETVELLSELEACLPDPRADLERHLDAQTVSQVLNRFLGSVNALEAAVFVSRYYYAMTVRDVAEKYALPERRVKYILKCLREELRKSLMKEGIGV